MLDAGVCCLAHSFEFLGKKFSTALTYPEITGASVIKQIFLSFSFYMKKRHTFSSFALLFTTVTSAEEPQLTVGKVGWEPAWAPQKPARPAWAPLGTMPAALRAFHALPARAPGCGSPLPLDTLRERCSFSGCLQPAQSEASISPGPPAVLVGPKQVPAPL